MSIEVTNAVWKYSRQKDGQLLVLLALADYTNSEGIAWPAISTLACKVRMSKRNTQRCVRALEKAGELETRQNQGRKGSNIYRIVVPNIGRNSPGANDAPDAGVAKAVSRTSLNSDINVAQSVNKPSIEITSVVPNGDETEFWIKLCFRCFEQPIHSLPAHVLRALSEAIPALSKNHADSLIKFYQAKPLDSKEPPYSSRRHSPERLILDLPRQIALAVQARPPVPPPKKHNFTIQEVHDYLNREYPGCNVPSSLHALEDGTWEHIKEEIYDVMSKRNQNH